jgi:4-hydroxybenzoate polyprenyltransferase
MGWAAEFGGLSFAAIMIYFGSIAWTIGYDTIYAHQDKEDDALIGVRSTALYFGKNTKIWLTLFYGLTMLAFAMAFGAAGAAWPAWIGLVAAFVLLGWQILVLDINDGPQCLALFKFNHVVGAVLFAGLLLAIPFA